MSDTMAGAMAIIESFAPHRCPCESVELESCGVFREHRTCQLQVAFQYERICLPLFLRKRSERDGARNVGRSTVILRPTVEQEQTGALQANIRLWGSLIMYDSPMRAVGRNGLERQAAEPRLFGTQCRETAVNIHLRGHLAAFDYSTVEPCQETHHCHTVAKMCRTEPLLLCPILHGTPYRHGTFHERPFQGFQLQPQPFLIRLDSDVQGVEIGL